MKIVHYVSNEVDPQGIGVTLEGCDFAMVDVVKGRLDLKTVETAVAVEAGEVLFTKASNLVFPFASKPSRTACEFCLVIFNADDELAQAVRELIPEGPLTLKPGLGFSREQLERRLGAGTLLMQRSAEHYLSSFLYNVADSGVVAASSVVMEQHLLNAISYMKDHLEDAVNLDTIADANNISKTHLVRIFRKELGVTPMRYLTKLRVDRSSNILLESDMKLEDVAEKLTFYSDSHFSKVFKKITGENPSAYRHTYFDSMLSRQKKSLDELEKSYSFIQQLIDATEDLIFYKNYEGRYLGCNSAFCRFAGRANEEIIGKTDFDIFPPDMAEGFTYNDRKVIEDSKTYINEEWIRYKDGTKVLVEVSKSPFFWRRDEVAGLIGISRDITIRKITEERLNVAREEVEKSRRDKTSETRSALQVISQMISASFTYLTLLKKEEENEEKILLIDELIRKTTTVENTVYAFQGIDEKDDETVFAESLFSLSEIVDAGTELSSLLFPELRVEFEMEIGVPMLFHGAKSAVRKIVVSLLMHIGACGAKRVNFSFSFADDSLTILVKDDFPPLLGNRSDQVSSEPEKRSFVRTWDVNLRHCQDLVECLRGDWNIANTETEVVFSLIIPLQRGLK